jgi:hypothetical protein
MAASAPTVVLVHGAFADASSYARVVEELLADDIEVRVPAVPNRSLIGDAPYIASSSARSTDRSSSSDTPTEGR